MSGSQRSADGFDDRVELVVGEVLVDRQERAATATDSATGKSSITTRGSLR